MRIQHAAEGEEQRKKDEAVQERKRKADEKEHWENTREERISGEQTPFFVSMMYDLGLEQLTVGHHNPLLSDWRSFQKGAGKKKKKASNTLG